VPVKNTSLKITCTPGQLPIILLLSCFFILQLAIMGEMLDASKLDGNHFKLAQLAGEWEGSAKTWFEPGKVGDESPVSGSMRLVLDGRFILYEYKGRFGGKPLAGMGFIGYHLGLGKFQFAWIDSFHNDTALMFSEGDRNSELFSMLGGYTYITPEAEHRWGWRTEIAQPHTNELIITAFNISPEGEEELATETVYKRLK